MSDTKHHRRTQAERRAESRQAVLDSACRLFAANGYANTALEDIAIDCGLTIRPIYHYFGHKKGLFAAVNEVAEQRIIASMQAVAESNASPTGLAQWRAYLDLCDDPGFRQVVLIDSPNILGRERWNNSPVSVAVRSTLTSSELGNVAEQFRSRLLQAVVMGAFAEAALTIAAADDMAMARAEAEQLMEVLFSGIWSER